jgi:hypothetical protein
MNQQKKSIRLLRAIAALFAILLTTWGLGATAATLQSKSAATGVTGDMMTGAYDLSEQTGVGDAIIRLIDPAGCGNGGISDSSCASEIDQRASGIAGS